MSEICRRLFLIVSERSKGQDPIANGSSPAAHDSITDITGLSMSKERVL